MISAGVAQGAGGDRKTAVKPDLRLDDHPKISAAMPARIWPVLGGVE